MSSSAFLATVAALWRTLELGAPKIEEGKDVILSVDGLNIVLSDSPDERRLLLSARAGQLGDNRGARAEQVRVLLRRSLAYLAVSRACVSVKEESSGSLVFVEACYLYERRNLAELVRIIHELLDVLEAVKGEIAPTTATPSKLGLSSKMDDTVIFLP